MAKEITESLKKEEDGTIILTIQLPWGEVKKEQDAIIDEAVKSAQLEGFRKGKAPRKLVADTLDKDKIREEVLKKVLPTAYVEAVKKHDLKPIINPKIHVSKVEEGKDWEFSATTCEMPLVDLGDYKKNIQKITAKGKIIIPGKEPFGNTQDKEEKPKFEDIVKALLDSTTASIPAILVEQEVERLLAQTLDEIKRLGLSLDQYLASTGKTAQDLRSDYGQKAQTDMKLEFALQKVGEQEKITIGEKEIEEALQKAKDDSERQSLESNKYLLASILRQQKTLDFLRNL